jgi:membrane associated rhomboid family serine protease
MIFVIPVGNETSLSRLPYVTAALILLNFTVFAFLPRAEMEKLDKQEVVLQRRADWIVLNNLVVQHPELQAERQKYPDSIAFLRDFPRWKVGDEDPKIVAAVEEVLKRQDDLEAGHPYHRFAFVPARPTLPALFTHLFLHAGFFHVFFNMLFLWMVGCVLEDSWGRLSYGIFYFLAGAAAIGTHTLLHPTSNDPCIGASGAVAGLMGAFAVRHYGARIRILFAYFLGLVPRVRFFTVPAYTILSLWFLREIFYGLMTLKVPIGIATWAHIGGFLFGAAAAAVIKVLRLDLHLPGAIPERKKSVLPARRFPG